MSKINKKNEKNTNSFEFSKIGSILDNIAKTVPIRIEKYVVEKKFISTGVYLLDAALSGRLLNGGISSNRITTFAGESGTGKSFLCYSVAKTAQKNGYSVIYIDTEQAMDLEDMPKYGIDISLDSFRLIHSNKVEDINIMLSQLINELKSEKLEGKELPKLLIILDSLGQMASNKEKEDLLKGEIKQDMTKAKALNSMFRSINIDLGYLDIPLLVANHTYLTMDLFPQEKLRGGNGLLYSSSVIGFMSKSKLKTGEEDDMDLGQTGISVTFKTQKNRLAKPKKIKFDISFIHGLNPFTGLDAFCRPEFFDKIGIAKGKMEINKQTGEMKFVPGGIRWYVNHLNRSIHNKELFSESVFTEEVLKSMEPIVNDYFRYKSLDEIEKIEKEFDDIVSDEFSDTENIDASEFFE